MILVLTHIIALVVGVVSGMGVSFAVNSHLRVRRQLKAAQKALEARPDPKEAPPTIRELQAIIDRRVAEFQQGDDFHLKPVPDFTGGIGPTAIRNREAFEAQQQEKAEPRFASPRTLNPDLTDIREAAREATNGRPN